MKYTDRQLMDRLIAVIASSARLIATLLEEEIEIMCIEQVVNVGQLTALGRARDRFASTALAMDFLLTIPK
jgi:hypothetical protein